VRHLRPVGLIVVAAIFLAGGLTACNDGGGSEAGDGARSTDPVVARGQRLVEERACLSCHTSDGTRLTGPSWKGLAGSTVELADGRRVVADRDYLRRAIQDPNAEVVKGFPSGIMAAVVKPGSVSAEEADAIAAYIETLK
jgi:cytochrome c oxidase subunit II